VLTTGALQAYVAFHGLMPFRRPLIVGSEWVSLSAALTCLLQGARPVAMLEPGPYPLASAFAPAFPALTGIPFRRGAEIVDIIGGARVEAVAFRVNGETRRLACDGVLLTGRFTPEAALFAQSSMGVDAGSAGPAIDQDGRCANPLYFAAGNVLRAIETGGWSFREGRAVGAAVAEDLRRPAANGDPVAVRYADPIKLVAPSLLRDEGLTARPFARFQLRFARRARGRLALEINGREVWGKRGAWAPERRVLAPLPDAALSARRVQFRFHEEGEEG
jgi:NADPH-dependent 2,4-dienoyl-CoA reductase/sulfur reductase-like enzyme